MKKQDYTEEIKHIEALLVKLKDNNMEPPKPMYLRQKIEFEVYPEDLSIKHSFIEALAACKLLGEGWRLPTRAELLLMYENKDKIKGFANNGYWSSTEVGTNDAWSQDFYNGIQANSSKDYYFNVRAVKSFDCIININH
tara:strand:- start:3340 stop:3756 length:417 start_codon:yes stop_codon:yes gene_type:complete